MASDISLLCQLQTFGICSMAACRRAAEESHRGSQYSPVGVGGSARSLQRVILVKKLRGGADGKLFEFIDGSAIPRVIKDALKRIRRQWRHGSAVLIPAFNYFGYSEREDVWLSEVVAKVAAYNFSAAIHAGELVVEIDEQELDGGTTARVDRSTLGEILESEAGRRRAYRRETVYEGLRPSGRQAWATWRTLAEGAQATVSTMFGPHRGSLAYACAGRLDACRPIPQRHVDHR